MEHNERFYNLGRQLVISEVADLDDRLKPYLAVPAPVFSMSDFQHVCEESINPNAIKFTKKSFEEGWKDGQVERFQVEAILQASFDRKMNEKTLQKIAAERRRVAQEIFKR